MTGNVYNRLQSLSARRQGTDRLNVLAYDAKIELFAAQKQEAWQERAKDRPNTRYALGSMQEVGELYTRISIETAERVGKQLQIGLAKDGIVTEYRLQGSVPLNVHIRGVSDVDLLTIRTDFFTYANAGLLSESGHYKYATTRSSLEVLAELRRASERICIAAYPAATVDISGGKAITLSGGSLRRPVDVVPSHWFDSVDYQRSRIESDRGITILDKTVPLTIDNYPFLHIQRVATRCNLTLGSLRKSIRLCKNVKADAIMEGKSIGLPSFDIAATMYHANVSALLGGYQFELAILAETQRHLDFLATNHNYARTLLVPDGSRHIFDTAAKLVGLNNLSVEIDELARAVAKEIDWLIALGQDISMDSIRASLRASNG